MHSACGVSTVTLSSDDASGRSDEEQQVADLLSTPTGELTAERPIPSDMLPSTVVVDTVAELMQCTPVDLEPLYTSIDPDCLDSLFQTTSRGARKGTITFPFARCAVTVRDGRWVSVVPDSDANG